MVYPDPRSAGFDPLAYLAGFLDLVEINSTFYRPATVQMAKGWARRVSHNPRFKFTAKLWQGFTHLKEPVSTGEERFFKNGLLPLLEAGLLGCLLLQFPWSFKNVPGNQDRLASLFDRFQEWPKALEVRHASWNVPAVFEFLAEKGVGFVNIDQPLIGRSLGPTQRVTSPVGYVRLHGRNYQDWFREGAGTEARYDYLYSEDELAPWAERVQKIAASSKEVYVITNNHFHGQAVVNALQLKFMITADKLKVPASLLRHYPQVEKMAQQVI